MDSINDLTVPSKTMLAYGHLGTIENVDHNCRGAPSTTILENY
ncbi:hypothetical protein [Wolbachia endosymbiont of Kerria lacca]